MSYLIKVVEDFASEYMKKYCDPCHDFEHVLRVKNMALKLAYMENIVDETRLQNITIAALLHDVADHKIAAAGENRKEIITNLLDSYLDINEINTIYTIVKNVSYSNEIKIGELEMNKLIQEYPDLSIVQDADRIDAIGAIGVMRTSSYSGFRNKPLRSSIEHFDEKLLQLGKYMKTNSGREIANNRIEFMKQFVVQYQSEI
jgi:uncharacterized protein